MKYGHEKDGIELLRDCFGEHFDSEIHFNYMVRWHGEICDEDANPFALAKRLKKAAKRLESVARFLERRKEQGRG